MRSLLITPIGWFVLSHPFAAVAALGAAAGYAYRRLVMSRDWRDGGEYGHK